MGRQAHSCHLLGVFMLSIRQKLIVLLGFFLLIMLIMAGLIFFTGRAVSQISETLEKNHTVEHLINMAEIHVEMLQIHFNDYVNNPSADQKEEYRVHNELTSDRLKEFLTGGIPARINKNAVKIEADLQKIQQVNDGLFSFQSGRPDGKIDSLLILEGERLYRDLNNQLVDAHEAIHDSIKKENKVLDELESRSKTFTLILLGILLAATPVVGWRFSASIFSRLAKLTEATKLLSLGQRVPQLKKGSEDEIGRLISSFNRLSDDLESSKRKAQQAKVARQKTEQALIAINNIIKASGTISLRQLLEITVDKLIKIPNIILAAVHLNGHKDQLALSACNKDLNEDVRKVLETIEKDSDGFELAIKKKALVTLSREKFRNIVWMRQLRGVQRELKSIESIILIPLFFNEDFLGILTIGSRSSLDAEELMLIESAAFSLVTVVRNRQLSKINEEKHRELMNLKVVTDVNLSWPLDKLLNNLLTRAAQSIGLESSVIFEGGNLSDLKLKAAVNWSKKVSPQDLFADNVLTTKKPFVMDNLARSPFLSRYNRKSPIASLITVPLLSADQIIGILSLYSSEVVEFDQKDINLVEVLAERVATVLIHVDLVDKFNAWQRRYDSIFNSTSDLVLVIDDKGELIAINQAAQEVLGYDLSKEKNLSANKIFNNDSLTVIFDAVSEQLAKGVHPRTVRIRAAKKDGTFIDLNTVISAITTGGETIIQFVASIDKKSAGLKREKVPS